MLRENLPRGGHAVDDSIGKLSLPEARGHLISNGAPELLAAFGVNAFVTDDRMNLRVEKIHRVMDDAARAMSLAAVQLERVDQLLATTCARLDEAAAIVLRAVGGPLQQAGAVAMAFRAAFAAFRGWQKRTRPA